MFCTGHTLWVLVGLLLTGFDHAAWAQVEPQLDADIDAQQIMAQLGPGQGARLPAFHVVGPPEGLAQHETFATLGPGIRDYCMKWVYARQRGRALYAGGNHGAPHKFDDVWEFDLQANTWVMLHAPDPGITPLHTWWGLTFDQSRGLLYWMAPMVFGNWPLVQDNDDPPLLAFDPAHPNQGWWYVDTDPDIPVSMASGLEYVPNRDGLLLWSNAWNGSGMQMLDLQSKTWSELESHEQAYHDDPSAPGAEAIVTYNDQLDGLVAFFHQSVFEYSFATAQWTTVGTDLFPASTDVTDHTASEDFLPVSNVHFIVTAGRLFAYDASDGTVEELFPTDFPDGHNETMLYVDRATGLVVIYEENVNQVYVYRYGEPQDSGDCDAGLCNVADGGADIDGEIDSAGDAEDIRDAGASDATWDQRRDGALSVQKQSHGGCSCRSSAQGQGAVLWFWLMAVLGGLSFRRR